MIEKILESAISATKNAPVIQWQDNEWSKFVDLDPEFSAYMNNRPVERLENKRVHGYFALLHNIVSAFPTELSICELGNREGLSTLAILDAMTNEHKFVSVDIVPDLRFIPSEKANPLIQDNIFFPVVGDCLEDKTLQIVESFIKDKPIGLLFCDTIHTYEQVSSEIQVYERLLADEAIVLVDDIQDWGEWLEIDHPDRRTKYKFFKDWQGEKYDLTELCHYPTGFGAFIYRRVK